MSQWDGISDSSIPSHVLAEKNRADAAEAERDRYREALDTAGRYVANALDSLGELPDDEPSNTAAYLMSAQMALAVGGDPE